MSKDYSEKNANRRRAKQRTPDEYRAGRRIRREMSFGGAFGQCGRTRFNECARGTMAMPRSKGEQEAGKRDS